MKPILAIDMDEVLANFSKAAPEEGPAAMYSEGFFLNLEVMPGALEAVRQLYKSNLYDIHILSKPVQDSPISYTEKIKWISMHFPYLLNKVTLTQDKSLFLGHYLIDDSIYWQSRFPGKFLYFDKTDSRRSWQNMVSLLLDDTVHDALSDKECTPIFI